MFGYTYDEFMEMTHGTASGMVYHEDEPQARRAVEMISHRDCGIR